MMAKLVYKVLEVLHPFNEDRAANGEKAFCLMQQTKGELAELWEQPIAVFNRTSEVEVFLAHLYEVDPGGMVIEIPSDYRELFNTRRKSMGRR